MAYISFVLGPHPQDNEIYACMDILAREPGQAGRSSHNLVGICYAETRSSLEMCKLRQEVYATLAILAH